MTSKHIHDHLSAAGSRNRSAGHNRRTRRGIRLLGRQTSGKRAKAIFCLEELGLPHTREDYGRQFGNTLTDAYRKLNQNAKVPTMIDGDLVIWSRTPFFDISRPFTS